MAGMLLWGVLGDFTGRKWGSRWVASIMLSGCVLLTFSPYAPSAYGYFTYCLVAQTWWVRLRVCWPVCARVALHAHIRVSLHQVKCTQVRKLTDHSFVYREVDASVRVCACVCLPLCMYVCVRVALHACTIASFCDAR